MPSQPLQPLQPVGHSPGTCAQADPEHAKLTNCTEHEGSALVPHDHGPAKLLLKQKMPLLPLTLSTPLTPLTSPQVMLLFS